MKFKDVQNLSDIDVTQMSHKQLKEVASVLFPVVNKRIERLEKGGYGESSALRGLKLSQNTEAPKFKISDTKSRNQLLSQIISAQNFAKSKTGSVSSLKRMEKDFFNRYGGKQNIDSSEFWKEYRKFEEENTGLVNRLSSDFIVSQLTNIFHSAELKSEFLTNNDFRKSVADSVENYVDNMDLEPEDYFTEMV